MPLLRFLSIKQNACGGFSFYRKTITLHYKMLLEKSLRWNHRADPEFSLLTRPSSLADTPTIHTVVFSHSLLLIEGTKERHTTSINGEECGQVSKLKKLGKAERQICKSFPQFPGFFSTHSGTATSKTFYLHNKLRILNNSVIISLTNTLLVIITQISVTASEE